MADRRSLWGALGSLAKLRRREFAIAAACLGLLALFASASCRPSPTRIATFNIENFPRDGRQVAGAFETIRELEAPLVAVQEINEPAVFEAALRRELGVRWRVAFGPGPKLHLGLAYDSERYAFLARRIHDEVRIRPKHRPVLEVQLRERASGVRLRVFVVHLKSGGRSHELRRRQLEALAPIVRDARLRAEAEGDEQLVVLGDFNSTGPADRQLLGEFSGRTGLIWASQALECTAYWTPGGKCRGSALDHVFTSAPPSSIAARGPCEVEGCEPGDRCPVFHAEVSDHCPVSATF